MRATIKNNERNYDIRNPLARYRRANSIGHSRYFQNSTITSPPYVSRSDWAVHRSRGLGRWSIYGAALRHGFFTFGHRSVGGTNGKPGRVWTGHGIKNLARVEMKRFLIEQIPVLLFIAVFFLMLALGG